MTYIFKLLITALAVEGISLCSLPPEDLPCQARVFSSGTVCVCDSHYCDTVAPPHTLPIGQYHHYFTAEHSPGFSRTQGQFESCTSCKNGTPIEIFNEHKYQKILGFGGAFTDSAAIVYHSLPKKVQDYLIRSYFGDDGIEYTLCRVPIGGTDFSTRYYTLDDVWDDVDLHYFDLADEDYKYKIPMMKKAMEASTRGINVCAAAWYAPNWMKTQDVSGYIKPEYYSAWAKYHIKFLEKYRDEGINIWAMSGGNEVKIFDVLGYPTNFTMWTPEDQVYWFKNYLLPEMQAANFTHVKLLALDDQRNLALDWMSYIFKVPEVYEAIYGIALHWYQDYITATKPLNDLHLQYPDKPIMYTEGSINAALRETEDLVIELGKWKRAEIYMYDIIQNINHWSATFIDWNLDLNTSGGPTTDTEVDAAILVNTTSGEFYKQPIFYALGHFSKFISPGSCRVEVKTPNEVIIDDYELQKLKVTYDTDAMNEWFQSFTQEDGTIVYPPIVIPPWVHCLATANPDGSHTVVLMNPLDKLVEVNLKVAELGCTNLHLIPHSINSVIYWSRP